MAPNTNVQVRLIQGNDDCFTIDGYITTNKQGNGTLNVSEAAVSTKAAVFIWGADYTGDYFESAIFTHPWPPAFSNYLRTQPGEPSASAAPLSLRVRAPLQTVR